MALSYTKAELADYVDWLRVELALLDTGAEHPPWLDRKEHVAYLASELAWANSYIEKTDFR